LIYINRLYNNMINNNTKLDTNVSRLNRRDSSIAS